MSLVGAVTKKASIAILVAFLIFVSAIALIGSLILAPIIAAEKGVVTAIQTAAVALGELFSPNTVTGYACIDPNALSTGQTGTAAGNSDWLSAIEVDANGNPKLAASLLMAGYLTSNGQADFVSAGRYGVYGILNPGSGENFAIKIDDAKNPALATNYMLPRIANAMNVVDPNLWTNTPDRAAAAVAYAALEPDQKYSTQAISEAWTSTVVGLKKLKLPTEFTSAVTTAPLTTSVLGKNPSLFEAIRTLTGNNPNLQLAMLMGSYLESGWVNDGPSGAGAYGPFQIQHPTDAPIPGPPVHGNITVSEAQDPAFAAKYMLPAYQAAMDPKNTSRKVNFESTLWTSNPKMAAEYTAYNAERPADLYQNTQGQQRVDEAYNASLLVMNALGSSTQFIDSNCVSALSPGVPLGTLPDGPAGQIRGQVISAAMSLLGTPYSWGGGHNAYGPTYGICAGGAAWNDCHIAGVDCSGLTRYAFHAVDIDIGDTAANQWQRTKGHEVPMDKVQPGDLLFWTGSDGSFSAPGHVAIYTGGGKAIMAPQSGDVVKIADITTPFWQNSFVGATDPYQQ